MSALIPITGVAFDFRTPGSYAEILFGQGESSAAAGVREVVLVMPMLSTGTWTAATLYGPVANEQEVETGAGSGSPLHRGARAFLKVNKDAKLFCLPVAETSSGSPIAATGTVVFVNTATGAGVASVWICGEECQFAFASGTTITQMGDGIQAAINAKPWLPVTALNAAGTVTLTAKLKGTSQGTATVRVIGLRGSITSGVATTITVSTHIGAVATGVEGSTTEAAAALTALGTIDSNRKYYIVSNGNTSTYLTNLKTHVVTKSAPKRGLRSVAIAAYVGTQAAAQTLAIAPNYERLNLICEPNSDHDCAELAAMWAARRQMKEQVDSAHNFDFDTWGELRPAFNPADWPDGDDISDAINDGVTLVVSHQSGAYVAMSVNTRSKNAAGTLDDFRATETHRVSVCDEWVDERMNDFALNFTGKKLADDERLADGTVNPNQRLVRNVVKPTPFKKPILKSLQDYEDAGKLQDAAASKESLRVVKSPVNSGRLECGVDLHVVDHLHQATFRVAEVSTG